MILLIFQKVACTAVVLGLNDLLPNNSFKPNALRSTKHMAEKACHVFGSATHVGLTQALGNRKLVHARPALQSEFSCFDLIRSH